MISMPSCDRVRARPGRQLSPAATSARSIRIFTARKPAACAASTASARSPGALQLAERRVRRELRACRPEQGRHRLPGGLCR